MPGRLYFNYIYVNALNRVSGRAWSLVRITVPNALKSVKIGVEEPQNSSLYPYFQREPL